MRNKNRHFFFYEKTFRLLYIMKKRRISIWNWGVRLMEYDVLRNTGGKLPKFET